MNVLLSISISNDYFAVIIPENTYQILPKYKINIYFCIFYYSLSTKYIKYKEFLFNFSGNSYVSLQFHFRVKNNTICEIVPETCQAIYDVLKNDYLKVKNLFLFIVHYYILSVCFFNTQTKICHTTFLIQVSHPLHC